MKRELLLAALLAVACGPRNVGGVVSIQTTTVENVGAPVTIDLSYQAKSNRQVDIIMKFTNSSIEESEKITSEVTIQGFNIVEGGLFWDGFVPPRQPQSHTVHLVVAEGFDAARAEITVRRAADSTVLVAESLQLTVGADGRVQAGP